MPKHQSIKKPIAGVLSFSVDRPEKKVCVRSDFEIGKMLGKGGFGTVYLCREIKTNKTMAIKEVKKSKLTNEQALQQLKREIQCQHSLRHNHILQLHDYFDDLQHVYILLEACQLGSLYRFVRKHDGLSLHRATYVIDCMADALNYCHIRHVIHRDIKPENILLTEEFVPKLADFGWAVRTEKKTQETMCGTPDYLSPEMLNSRNKHAHTFKVDNWAIGVLYYECLAGRAPFSGKDQATTFRNIEAARIHSHSKIPDDAMKIIKGNPLTSQFFGFCKNRKGVRLFVIFGSSERFGSCFDSFIMYKLSQLIHTGDIGTARITLTSLSKLRSPLGNTAITLSLMW
uniref:Aurora kinase n=1 Tax=Panagrellus redivivus TaxID=6233 RepID=A0A7E4ZZY9_PANRE